MEQLYRSESSSKQRFTSTKSDAPYLKNLFSFKVEERLECVQSKHVKYSEADNLYLGLEVQKELASNYDEWSKYQVCADVTSLHFIGIHEQNF